MSITLFGFSKAEKIAVGSIILIIGVAMYLNLTVALRRSRDAQRKADIRSVYDALATYQNDFGYFPAAENGKIIACGGEQKDKQGKPILEPCEWGWDKLSDVADPNYPAYLERIPSDPQHHQGKRYHYISNSKRFQIYAYLEGEEEDEYDPKIIARNLPCGNEICNFGLGFSKTPTDITLEQYEEQIKVK